MIRSFADRRTQAIFEQRLPRGISRELAQAALRKLLILHAAHALDDLRVPPGNRLEALHGDRRGQHAIRVNDQWRLCFVWQDGHALAVELVDYH